MPWRGCLIDVGGVLHLGDAALPGAAQALAALRRMGVPFRLLSNTSSRSRRALAARLAAAGLPVGQEDLLTATVATAAHLRRVGGACLFFVRADVRDDLVGIPEDADRPAHVVVGDTPEIFGREAMDRACRALRAGADLIAMAKNRWFATAAGPAVDIGAAVAALEYAADVHATVIGKPSPTFFLEGARSLGLAPAEVVMVGDDPEADVVGAMEAGLGGVFVGAADAWAVPGRAPQTTIRTVAELPGLFGRVRP